MRISYNRKDLAKYLTSLDRRFAYFLSSVAEEAARYVHAQVKEGLPKHADYAALSSSLKVASVGGKQAAWVVFADPKRRRLSKDDRETSLLVVVPNRGRLRKVPRRIDILARYSPWTMDTIPFYPKKSEATVALRKVRKREVDDVSKTRSADKREWSTLLRQEGVKLSSAKDKKKEAPKGMSDLAFQALRVEYGLDGKAKALWRPALRRVRSSGFWSRSQASRAFDPAFAGYTKSPKDEVSLSKVKYYSSFQRRLGYK